MLMETVINVLNLPSLMYGMKTYLKKADIITFLNIALGFLALLFILNNNINTAARLILIAVVADGFDGYFARKSKTESEFGMNFDSLSDCISFGAAPALLAYTYVPYWWMAIVSVLYLSAGVLRLARYNVSFEDTEEGTFIGMPIPLGALLAVLAIISVPPDVLIAGVPLYVLVAGIVLVISYLMVCSINFKKIAAKRFPVQNFAVLFLVVLPIQYLIPLARIAFVGCLGGVFMRKRRN